MKGRFSWPAFFLIVGGAILAISPWLDHLSVPGIDPTKPVDGAWVVVVEETSERNPTVAKIANDGEYWRGLESRGIGWRFYDIDSKDAKSYVEPAKKAGVPALIIVSSEGKVLKATGLPATTTSIDEVVKEVVGK